MNKKIQTILGLSLMAAGVTDVLAAPRKVESVLGVPFVKYGQSYQTKIDFADLDYNYPISKEALKKLKPADLQGLNQEYFDQLYARLSSGPLPDGVYDGEVFFLKDGGLLEMGSLLDKKLIPAGLRGVAEKLADLTLDHHLGKKAMEALWFGKRFDRDGLIARNRISSKTAPIWSALGFTLKGAFDFLKPEIERFPAKMYCGTSFIDVRRESVIIDYNFGNEVPGYQEKPDALTTFAMLGIRDEIRMVRPGFYIGKSYFQKIFQFNFALYRKDLAEAPENLVRAPVKDECWSGSQEVKSSLASPMYVE